MKFELRGFVAGLLCGAILIAAVWAGSVWWKSRSEDVWISVGRSPGDATMYDACLVGQNGAVAPAETENTTNEWDSVL
jgi:hypothetical protein